MFICDREPSECTCMQHRLLDCLEKGLIDSAKLILQEFPKLIELVDASGSTLLHYSVQYRHEDMVKFLIERGCSINAPDDVGLTPVMQAFSLCFEPQGFPKLKPSLVLTSVVGKVSDDFLKNPAVISTQGLLEASNAAKLIVVAIGCAELAGFLLNTGYPIDYQEPQRSRTALHVAILLGQWQNARMLIERGSMIDTLDEYGNSALHYYSVCRFEVVDENSLVLKSLLSRSRTLAKPSGTGLTDIEEIFLCCNKSAVRTVLASGIDVDSCLIDGRPVLQLLVENNSGDDVLSALDELSISFDVDYHKQGGWTALMWVASVEGPRKMQFLLENGANLNLPESILHNVDLAPAETDERDDEIATNVEMLLEYGARDASMWFTSEVHYNRIAPPKPVSLATCVVVAHLAMTNAMGDEPLTDLCRARIAANPSLRSHFEWCTWQLEHMKRCKVYNSVTLYHLLTESDKRLKIYVLYPELIAAFESVMLDWSHLHVYYYRRLKSRLVRAAAEVKLRDKVEQVIAELTGLYSSQYPAIVDQLIKYIGRQGMKALSKID